MGTLFNSKLIASEIQDSVGDEIWKIRQLFKIEPVIAMIILDHEDSLKMAELGIYSALGNQLGITIREIILDPSIVEDQLIRVIYKCNANPSIHGILVLSPLPKHIDQEKVLSTISPNKEIEGFNENKNQSDFEGKQNSVWAALLKVTSAIQLDIFNSQCVFILDNFTLCNATMKKILEKTRFFQIPPTIVTKETDHVKEITQKADLLAVSLQTPGIIDKNYIKDDATVIDFNHIIIGEKYCEKKCAVIPLTKSSLNVDSLLTKAKYVLPAADGIEPVSLAHLMRNFLYNYKTAVFR